MYTGYSRVLLQGSCTCVFAKCTRTHVTIPHDNTDIASNILLTLDCSDNICGCHLLHALCNHPFYKPLHPPGLRPSPFLSILWRRKGEGRRPGGWRGLSKGWLQSGVANDNRICCPSNRALGGCRLRHTYCHEGLRRMFGCTLRRHKCNCPWSK